MVAIPGGPKKTFPCKLWGFFVHLIYSKHEESAAGISQRMRRVSEQLKSYNLASPVYKKTHVSLPSFARPGFPLCHVELSTGVPSAHWNCPCGVRPMSEADTQNQFEAARRERKIEILISNRFLTHFLTPSTASQFFWHCFHLTQSFETRQLHSSLRAPLTRFVPSYPLYMEKKIKSVQNSGQ